jgi:hypothetical protein
MFPAYLNSGKKWCVSIYLLNLGGNYGCAPSELPRLGTRKKLQDWKKSNHDITIFYI